MNKLSFCVNTARNELNHIKLLFNSFKENLSTHEHEIVVFIDADNQNTFEWLLTQKVLFPNLKILRNELPIPYGYQRNINEMFLQASNDIVSYIQSDMVVCKNYDLEILQRIGPNTILCSTRVEPPLHGNSGEKITYDFGLDPTTFDLKAFTDYAESQKEDQYTEYFFAPFTLYKEVWNSIGGHDTLFRRSREDSDVLSRLVANGVAIKQTWSALVYHFTCTSSRGLNWFDPNNKEAQQKTQLQQHADFIEMGRYLKKWGAFQHGTNKKPYYKVDAKILGNPTLQQFINLEIFFDKVYIESKGLITEVQKYYDYQQTIANKLLNIEDGVWETYKYFYNRETASDRIKLIDELGNEDVLVTFDVKDINQQHVTEFLSNLQDIILEMDEVGEFEYGPFKITINNIIDRSSSRIIVKNPDIKPEHLYTIH